MRKEQIIVRLAKLRLLAFAWNEAMRMFEVIGLAEDIDKAMSLGYRHQWTIGVIRPGGFRRSFSLRSIYKD